jgi:hypothetical protein
MRTRFQSIAVLMLMNSRLEASTQSQKLVVALRVEAEEAQSLEEAQFSAASEVVATMARVPVVVQGYLRRKRP